MIRLYNPEIFNPRLVLNKLALGVMLAGLIASSKIHAVMALMQYFPRVVNEVYPIGISQALIGLIAQLLGAMFLAPFLVISAQDVSLLSGALSNITGAHYGIWETDIGLSPVLIVLLLFGLGRVIKISQQRYSLNLNVSSHILTWVMLTVGVWLSIEMTLAKGLIYPYIKTIPIIRSMHVNVRFAAVFILPLILVGVAEYETLTRAKPRQILFPISAGMALAFMFIYNLFPADVHTRNYDLTKTLQTDAAIRRGEHFPIDHVAAIEDEDVFAEHATNLPHYEPLFSIYDRIEGYLLSKDFAIQVQPGPVTETDNGYYNMTNPASLVFPKENKLQPFERIKIGEEEQLQAFIQRRQPDWKISNLQRILDWISLIAFGLTISLIIFPIRFQRLSGIIIR